jgi:hypothetical protein
MAESPAQPQTMSPELVLVDPCLAMDARERLPDLDDALSRHESPSHTANEQPPIANTNLASALRRLTELADMEPSKPRRRYRALKLAAAVETWSLVAVLVAQTHLYAL